MQNLNIPKLILNLKRKRYINNKIQIKNEIFCNTFIIILLYTHQKNRPIFSLVTLTSQFQTEVQIFRPVFFLSYGEENVKFRVKITLETLDGNVPLKQSLLV